MPGAYFAIPRTAYCSVTQVLDWQMMSFTAKTQGRKAASRRRHLMEPRILRQCSEQVYTDLVPGSDRGYTKGGTNIFLTTADTGITGDTDSFPLCRRGQGGFGKGADSSAHPTPTELVLCFRNFDWYRHLGSLGNISLSVRFKIKDLTLLFFLLFLYQE